VHDSKTPLPPTSRFICFLSLINSNTNLHGTGLNISSSSGHCYPLVEAPTNGFKRLRQSMGCMGSLWIFETLRPLWLRLCCAGEVTFLSPLPLHSLPKVPSESFPPFFFTVPLAQPQCFNPYLFIPTLEFLPLPPTKVSSRSPPKPGEVECTQSLPYRA
jgi:hypothetical protein